MAKIEIKNIDRILLNVLPFERRFDSQGDLAVNSLIREVYERKGYHSAPKSPEEAAARGIKNFNGLMTSSVRISCYCSGSETIVAADLAPARYLLGQAMRDYVKENPSLSEEEIRKLSPDLTNVSLIAPVKFRDQYFLLSQIKGKALGSGEIHAGLVAGNIDAGYLSESDPLTATLQGECSEELGMDLSYLDTTSFIFLMDERETGQINFASVAKTTDINKVLNAYDCNTRTKLPKEQLEVMALSMLPIGGIALVPLEKGQGVQDLVCFHPSLDGLKEVKETRGVRPYTQATLDYLAQSENTKFLLEKAGF